MRSALRLSLSLVVLGGLALTGGCVSQKEFDDVVAMNRRANDELQKAQDRLRLLESEKQALEGQLADRDRTIKFQADQIATLTAAKDALDREIAAARAEIERLKKPNTPVAPSGLPTNLVNAIDKWLKDHPGLGSLHGNMLRFQTDLTFEKGSDEVKPDVVKALKELSPVLTLPDAKQFNVYVAGHTDDIPLKKPDTIAKHGTNTGLSAHRAISVMKVLAEGGVDQPRMAAVGFGKYHPIEQNAAGEKGNAANRRVEIWLVPNDLLLTQPTGSSVKPGTGTSKTGPEGEEG